MTEGRCQILLASVPYNGKVYERFCDAPATRHVNGWFCPDHAAVQPFPDPTMTAAALRANPAKIGQDARPYGEPGYDADLEVVAMRVLKVHKEAVARSFDTAAAVINAVGMDGFAEQMAGAVLAADSTITTRHIVGVRVPGFEPYIFGPFPSRFEAEKAVRSGLIPKLSSDATAYVLPMQAAPRAAGKKAKKSKTDDAA